MPKTLGILFLHGIGTLQMHMDPDAPYSKDLEKGILERLPHAKKANVAFQEVIYQDVLDQYQSVYFEEAMKKGLDDRWTRLLFMKILGDATAYANNKVKVQVKGVAETLYNSVHGKIDQAIAELEGKLDPGAKLVVLAHSLGGLVFCNYIYDILHDSRGGLPPLNTPFRKLETCEAMVTFGCNIPLFAMTLDQFKPISIPLSNHGIPPNSGAYRKRRWLNVYDRDDPLGWPLLPLTKTKCRDPQHAGILKATVVDKNLEVGAFWNPLQTTLASHLLYWGDSGFAKKVCGHIKAYI
ncbi:MAG: hypothetical protein HN742_19105 [Lentisphaerae bacterium]|jgi:hypothetical protein|nr:hypothetical protein [Lentisphaerota bacterium]MBT4817260.1 hypothetical protein [Lentisphaerota bacterium]MBT5607800.1 hypothetical protein [Lentisphaerota bacterium]MBT7061780.1 hypothetical protein [Lentisphaerota bacterium]MBT7843996.1 hypothetical protein [Lentisphaerota bacterium]